VVLAPIVSRHPHGRECDLRGQYGHIHEARSRSVHGVACVLHLGLCISQLPRSHHGGGLGAASLSGATTTCRRRQNKMMGQASGLMWF
jgi:hypothetical protein